ncbi:unnamed protein product [Merluccius merluccius]
MVPPCGDPGGEPHNPVSWSHPVVTQDPVSWSHPVLTQDPVPWSHPVVTQEASDMQKVFDLMGAILQKGRQACQLVSHSLGMCGPSPLDRTLHCPGHHHLLHPPATTLIINISNSTLVDCAIGSGNYLPLVVEKQPLLGGHAPLVHEPRCSCFHSHLMAAQPTAPPPPASIQVHSSNLKYVIIGDNNHMQVDQTPCQGPPWDRDPADSLSAVS